VEERCRGVRIRLEKGSIDLAELAVETMPRLIEDQPIHALPCILDQQRCVSERTADELAIGECRDSSTDVRLCFAQGRARSVRQARRSGKIAKVRRKVIADVVLGARRSAGTKL
jgi:hypothetical protein